VLGRGLAAGLLSQGHQVAGIARHRPRSWPSTAEFITADIRDDAAVVRAVNGADVVAHCAWARSAGPDERISEQVNIDGTQNVLDAMAGTGRIVFVSSAHALDPDSAEGRHKARVEEMLAASGGQWVAVRTALVVGRSVDNWVRRLLSSPVLPDIGGSADRTVQVVHLDDALRLLIRAILDPETGRGPVDLAAPGEPTFRDIARALGRPVVSLAAVPSALWRRISSLAELELIQSAPLMEIGRAHV